MYSNIDEAKKNMEKKLKNEKIEDFDESLLTFSLKRTASSETFHCNNNDRINLIS